MYDIWPHERHERTMESLNVIILYLIPAAEIDIMACRAFKTTSSTAIAYGMLKRKQSRIRVYKTIQCMRLMFATAMYNR